jgi:hypothetical protein
MGKYRLNSSELGTLMVIFCEWRKRHAAYQVPRYAIYGCVYISFTTSALSIRIRSLATHSALVWSHFPSRQVIPLG